MTGQPFNPAYPRDTEETFAPEGKEYDAMESYLEGKREIHHGRNLWEESPRPQRAA